VKISPKNEWVLLAALIAGYVAVCFPLSLYRNYVLLSVSADSGSMVQAVWTTAHGYGLLYLPWLGGSYLGDHFSPLLAFLAPLYLLVPHVGTILFVKTLGIGLAAWPTYLLARRRLKNRSAALVCALVPLVYPTILSQHFNQINPDHFILPHLLFSFYFFETRRPWPFVLFALLALGAKETVAGAIFMFGVYALVQRRGWAWVVLPLLVSTAFFLGYYLFFGPYCSPGGELASLRYLDYLGGSKQEIARTLLKTPWAIFRPLLWQKIDKIVYALALLAPLGFIPPCLSLPSLIALPDFFANLIGPPAFSVLKWHYGIVVGSFFCVGSIYGIARLARKAEEKWGGRSELLLAVALLCTCLAGLGSILQPRDWQRGPNHRALKEALALIPPNASVLASDDLYLRLAERLEVVPWEKFLGLYQKQSHPRSALDFDYVTVNALYYGRNRQISEWVVRLLQSPEHGVIFDRDGMLVIKREQRAR
jgi:uncharacterized membrane protein